MKLIENLFGEFVDCIIESLPGVEPITRNEISYIPIGSHSIGFWLFIGIICAGMIACIFSKKFRSKFF